MGRYGDAYRDGRTRLTALARELDDRQLEAMVPACPAWRVRDVYAHLIGLVADVTGGRIDGSGTDAWTAAQVDARRDRPFAEVLGEWDEIGPAMETLLDDAPPAMGAQIVGDLATHEADVRGAIDRPDARDSDAVAIAFERYVRSLAGRVTKAGLPPVRIGDAVAGDGEPAASVRADRFELVRALTGRRTADQIRAYDWDGDAEPYVARFSAYGMAEAPVVE